MKQKVSLFVIALILVLPIALYAIFKAPQDSAALAAQNGKPVVLEFSSPMCSECQKLKKTLEIVEPKYQDKISFQKINAVMMDRKTQKQVEKYNVKVVPTTVFLYKDGNVYDRKEGAMTPDTFEEKLNELLK